MKWNYVANILKRDGKGGKCMAACYLEILQAVLLYDSESWIVSGRDHKNLRIFHQRVVQHMTGRHIQKVEDGWEYQCNEVLLSERRLFPIKSYVERRRGTL